MTPTRRQQLDRLCRSIRNGNAIWGDEGEAREEKAERVLKRARSRLAPIEKEEHRARMNELFERRYAIDTAIYYS